MTGDENPNHPSITDRGEAISPHTFLIKYKSDDDRSKFADLVLRLIKDTELLDYHITEEKAFVENRITYNNHTLALGDEIDYFTLREEFCKQLKH